MFRYHPVFLLAELSSLDAEEIMRGYWAGLDNAPISMDKASRSYWHGWRNGRVDSGHAEPDVAQRALVEQMDEFRNWTRH
jgi:hypothetical protein